MPRCTDLSNTQYALLALWTARQAKVEVDGLWEGKVKSGKKFWEEVRDLFTRQTKQGGWPYVPLSFPSSP